MIISFPRKNAARAPHMSLIKELLRESIATEFLNGGLSILDLGKKENVTGSIWVALGEKKR